MANTSATRTTPGERDVMLAVTPFGRGRFPARDACRPLTPEPDVVIPSGAKMLPEIVLPETTPETEWVRGRALQKMSPQRDHARVQMLLAAALHVWSAGRGEVATEWRFRIQPAGEARRPLVPDVAFVSYEAMRGFTREELQMPPFAPTVAIEIVSPGDRAADITAKISDYLRAGSRLVVVIDTRRESAALHDGGPVLSLAGNAVLRHDALPEFRLSLAPFFAEALRLGA